MGSIEEFLRKLDLGQLQTAQQITATLIAEKTAEPKVRLWMVCNENVVLKYFSPDQYLEAAKYLLEQAGKLAAQPGISNYKKKFELDYIHVGESELQEYLSHNG